MPYAASSNREWFGPRYSSLILSNADATSLADEVTGRSVARKMAPTATAAGRPPDVLPGTRRSAVPAWSESAPIGFDPLLSITNVGFRGTNRPYHHHRSTYAVYGFGGVLFGTGVVNSSKEALRVSAGNPAKARALSISICEGMLSSGCCRAH
jgi:hypothetical protein